MSIDSRRPSRWFSEITGQIATLNFNPVTLRKYKFSKICGYYFCKKMFYISNIYLSANIRTPTIHICSFFPPLIMTTSSQEEAENSPKQNYIFTASCILELPFLESDLP